MQMECGTGEDWLERGGGRKRCGGLFWVRRIGVAAECREVLYVPCKPSYDPPPSLDPSSHPRAQQTPEREREGGLREREGGRPSPSRVFRCTLRLVDCSSLNTRLAPTVFACISHVLAFPRVLFIIVFIWFYGVGQGVLRLRRIRTSRKGVVVSVSASASS